MAEYRENKAIEPVLVRLYRQIKGRPARAEASLPDRASGLAGSRGRALRPAGPAEAVAGDIPAMPGPEAGPWEFHSQRHLADVAPSEKGYVSANLPDVQVSGAPMVSVSAARAVLDPPAAAGSRQAAPLVPGPPVAANLPPSPTRAVTMASALDLYNDHFGLTERPFSLLPDPDFLFWSPAHRRAYTMLEYGILTCAPITLITGEVGAGKTTLVHHLLKTIDERVKIGLISNAHGSRGELLRWVLMALGQKAPHDATYVDLFAAFQAHLIEEYAGGNRVILIFDEAQNLSRDALEELRMFTNINANKDELLQLVLVGQPELRDIVRRPDMRQFAQRVAANFHLSAMDAPTVRAYIAHRLKVAGGGERNVFSRAATDLIHQVTGGVPRLVNQLCDLSMVYTFTKNQKIIMSQTVQRVLEDGAFFASGLDAEPSPDLSPSRSRGLAGISDEH
jgi:general secretion pathway protein A